MPKAKKDKKQEEKKDNKGEKPTQKPGKSKAIQKAKKAAKLYKSGVTKRRHKTHNKVRFYRPKTLQLERNPKYTRKSRAVHPVKDGFDKFSIILNPMATEKAMKKMEEENTLVFMVKSRANKNQIRQAFKRLYNTNVRSINTLIRLFLF